MHPTFYAFAVATLFFVSGCAHSQNANAERTLRLVPPVGYVGPERAFPGPGAETYAYAKERSEGQVRTLLQITKFDFGDGLKDLPGPDRGMAARHYLLQFLKGIEQRRTDYKQSEPTETTLGGEPAARAAWSGSLDGIDSHGVMYTVIVGTVVYQFHTQDAQSAPASDMQDAIRAIESLEFKRNG